VEVRHFKSAAHYGGHSSIERSDLLGPDGAIAYDAAVPFLLNKEFA
jgi:hypothetical protein